MAQILTDNWHLYPLSFRPPKIACRLQTFSPVIDHELKFVKLQFLVKSKSLWQQKGTGQNV